MSVSNFRSIKTTGDIRLESLQAFVGENNCGKSNLLRSIKCFLSSGAGGLEPSDFNDQTARALIECEFTGLTDAERKKLRAYLLGDRVILRKELWVLIDAEKQKVTVKAEYHGYQAEPKELHYSVKKIDEKGGKPDWQKIAEAGGFLAYAKTADGKVNKASFKAGLEQFLLENDVEYDAPTLGETQALGIPQNLLAAMPEFYLLPAITDYSDEIDRRSTSTVFRKLMGDLSERLLRVDPRYQEIEKALARIRALLNVEEGPGAIPRLAALGTVEDQLRDVVKRLMPSVQGVSLSVEIEEPKEIFSKGVTIKVNDGVLTDVLDKGHGMQRSLVFALLQMLIQSARAGAGGEAARSIILAIEEPELYIHPHSQRLIFGVLKGFAGVEEEGVQKGGDQVLYTTHAPAFIEISRYERVAVVRKRDPMAGTVVQQCDAGVLGTADEKRGFKLLTSFGLKHNEVFFSRDVILVEGPEDEIGIIATARKLQRLKDLPDELGLSIVVCDGKGGVPKFQKVLNAFGFAYSVLFELDGKPEDEKQNAAILENLNGNRIAKVPRRVEDLLKVGRHFDDQRHAKEFFSNPANINADMEKLVDELLPK
jgi:predicted ATP-dependent endonuclease of OLD family